MRDRSGHDAARKPVVIGYYGMQNIGDDAFCVVMNHALARYWGAEKPVFAAPPIIDLPEDRAGVNPKWYSESGALNHAGLILSKANLLRDASMVVFGGGSVFREMGRLSEKRLFSLWSQALKHPLVAVGVSVGPFVSNASAKRLGQVLRTMQYIGVRDQASAVRLHELGFTGTLVPAGDLAGLLPEAYGEDVSQPPSIPRGRPRLGVTMLGVDHEATDEENRIREDALIEGVRTFVERESADVTIFVFNIHQTLGDQRSSERLRQALRGLCDVRMVDAADGVRVAWEQTMACTVGLHMRLHGAVFAYMAGVPFALVPYQRKCDDFLDEIRQPTALRVDRVPTDASEVAKTLSLMLEQRQQPGVSRQEFAHRARLNFTEAPWYGA
jgi:polysaccharide pyruvyl transferase WcaK-like protein